jgi:MFS family permease
VSKLNRDIAQNLNKNLGMLIIWAKLSDIFGRKPAIIATMAIFVAFSGGCGASQTMDQL